jgi:hypothetical protein
MHQAAMWVMDSHCIDKSVTHGLFLLMNYGAITSFSHAVDVLGMQ